jgi:Fe-S cluster biogenesis protein NfuA
MFHVIIQEADKIREKVEEVLKEIRPRLQVDGGDIELVDVSDGTVKVKLVGACGTCPMSTMTLKFTVEAMLKEKIPEIKVVETV